METDTPALPRVALDPAVVEAIMLEAATPRFVLVYEGKIEAHARTRDEFNAIATMFKAKMNLDPIVSYYGIPLKPSIDGSKLVQEMKARGEIPADAETGEADSGDEGELP